MFGVVHVCVCCVHVSVTAVFSSLMRVHVYSWLFMRCLCDFHVLFNDVMFVFGVQELFGFVLLSCVELFWCVVFGLVWLGFL